VLRDCPLSADSINTAMTRRAAYSLISLGILIALLHAAILFLVVPVLSNRVTPFYNQERFIDGYDQLAENLVRGNGYRFYPDTAKTLMREPGYPLFVAGLMLAFGSTLTAVKLANMFLALVTAWIMTRLARKISTHPLMVIAPPLLFLFHPGTLIAESRGGVEILFTCLIMLFMLGVYAAIQNNKWWYYLITGAVLGLTVLVRSTPMLFPLFLLVYLLVVERQRIEKLDICRNITVMVLAMLVVLSPWIIRNYALTGRFVPTASVLGVSAHAGQYICMHLSEDRPWVMLDRDAARERSQLARQQGYQFKDGYYQAFYSTADELSFSAYLAKRVMSEYGRHPLLCARCVAYNLFNFWFAGKSWRSTAMNIVVQLPYLFLAILGSVVCARNKRFKAIGPMVIFVVYVVAVYVPILAQARYSMPLVPLLSILGTFALIAVREQTSGLVSATLTPDGSSVNSSESTTAELVGSGSGIGKRESAR
jgi:4-amino-4-deoxy-L-arabinose transferase-like glycosyltransferase